MTATDFKTELAAARRNYERYVVCIDKTPDEFAEAIRRLMEKAIAAYETRAPHLRHGIALDPQVTIILSMADGQEKPLCGIYFNLSSPYHRKPAAKPATSPG